MSGILYLNGYTAVGKTTSARYLSQALQERSIDSTLLSSPNRKHKLFGDFYTSHYGSKDPPIHYYSVEDAVGNPQRFYVIHKICKDAEKAITRQNKEVVILDSTFTQSEKRGLVYDLARRTGSKVYTLEIICNDFEGQIKPRLHQRALRHKRAHFTSPDFEAWKKGIYWTIKNEDEPIQNNEFVGLVRIGYDTGRGISNPAWLINGESDKFVELVITSLRKLYQEKQKQT